MCSVAAGFGCQWLWVRPPSDSACPRPLAEISRAFPIGPLLSPVGPQSLCSLGLRGGGGQAVTMTFTCAIPPPLPPSSPRGVGGPCTPRGPVSSEVTKVQRAHRELRQRGGHGACGLRRCLADPEGHRWRCTECETGWGVPVDGRSWGVLSTSLPPGALEGAISACRVVPVGRVQGTGHSGAPLFFCSGAAVLVWVGVGAGGGCVCPVLRALAAGQGSPTLRPLGGVWRLWVG